MKSLKGLNIRRKVISAIKFIQAAVLHRDSTGFPLSIKPSHLFDPVEIMDTAEVLSIIVERACSYTPEAPGKMFNGPKEERTKGLRFPKEELSVVDKVSPKEAFSEVVKVPMVASNLVRFISFLN